MSSLSEREHSVEALRFIQASAKALKESVANWRLCLKDALPLQERYGKFKLARTLNDFACDLRTLGQVFEAEVAIEESKWSAAPSYLPKTWGTYCCTRLLR